MTDPDTTAKQRLEVALKAIADNYCAVVYERHRFRLSPDEIVGLFIHAFAERKRIDDMRKEELRLLGLARTKPQKAVARGAWRDEKTPTIDPWANEDTVPGAQVPGGPRRRR